MSPWRTSPRNESRSLTATPSKESDQEKDADRGRDQNPRPNIFTGEADLSMKDVAQRRGGQHRREKYAEQVPHPKFGRVHHVE
jgi:hypothetical protein